jgi:hypothetical protein
MRYAIIKDNVVENVVLADAEVANANGWIECPNANPSWGYVNGNFIEPDEPNNSSSNEPTKEQLMAELVALTAKIQALE